MSRLRGPERTSRTHPAHAGVFDWARGIGRVSDCKTPFRLIWIKMAWS